MKNLFKSIFKKLFPEKYYYIDPVYEDLWWSYEKPELHLPYILDIDVHCIDKKEAMRMRDVFKLRHIPNEPNKIKKFPN